MKKDNFFLFKITLVEIFIWFIITVVLFFLTFTALDLISSKSIEPVEKTITKLHYEPSYTRVNTRFDSLTNRLETEVDTIPEEYQVICGSTTLQSNKEEYQELKVGDKLVVYYRRGGITKSKYVVGWKQSKNVYPESN